MTTFLLLHCYGGKHPEHWQSYLANHLKDRNANVLYPNLPDPEQPNLTAWLNQLEKVIENVDPSTLVVTAHSLGCTLWLHYLATHPDVRPQKVFLVAPPLNDCGIEQITSFFPLPELDLSDQADRYQMIGSDNDNFILEEEFHILSKNLGIPFKLLPGTGHIASPMHGDWEWMNKECFKYL